jgi:hypothetical protein
MLGVVMLIVVAHLKNERKKFIISFANAVAGSHLQLPLTVKVNFWRSDIQPNDEKTNDARKA